MGWAISADVAYDGTAFWMHVASPLRGTADRWGRALAAGSLALVIVVVLAVVSALVGHRPEAIPALVGCGFTARAGVGTSFHTQGPIAMEATGTLGMGIAGGNKTAILATATGAVGGSVRGAGLAAASQIGRAV